MTSRYETNTKKNTKDGRLVYKAKILPNIPLRDDDIHIITETGDRLDTLAYQFYQDQTLGWIIASANKIHNAVFALPEGTPLRIPQNYIEIISNTIK